MGRPIRDLTGLVFGRLRVICLVGVIKNNARWKCVCVCGGLKEASRESLVKGRVASCGCLAREQIKIAKKAALDRLNRIAEQNLQLGSKVCSVCRKRLSFDRFYEDSSSLVGRAPSCIDCVASVYLQRTHNLNLDDKRAMLEKQGGCCAGCLKPISLSKTHVDHCHETGFVRGALCARCNAALGLLRDDTSTLFRLIAYLNAAENAYGIAADIEEYDNELAYMSRKEGPISDG